MLTLAGSWIVIQAPDTTLPWILWLAHRPPWVLACGVLACVLIGVFIAKIPDIASHFRARHRSTLDPTQLEELMLGSPPQIIDLRPLEQYNGEKGHIRGAISMPFSEFPGRIGELDTSHPRPIVLVDETDKLSHLVMPALERRGHQWIYVLKGGFRAWRHSRYPVYVTPGGSKK